MTNIQKLRSNTWSQYVKVDKIVRFHIDRAFASPLRKGTQWKWEEVHQTAFQKLKATLTSADVMAISIPGKTLQSWRMQAQSFLVQS